MNVPTRTLCGSWRFASASQLVPSAASEIKGRGVQGVTEGSLNEGPNMEWVVEGMVEWVVEAGGCAHPSPHDNKATPKSNYLFGTKDCCLTQNHSSA